MIFWIPEHNENLKVNGLAEFGISLRVLTSFVVDIVPLLTSISGCCWTPRKLSYHSDNKPTISLLLITKKKDTMITPKIVFSYLFNFIH